jgi:hypothetical protein
LFTTSGNPASRQCFPPLSLAAELIYSIFKEQVLTLPQAYNKSLSILYNLYGILNPLKQEYFRKPDEAHMIGHKSGYD